MYGYMGQQMRQLAKKNLREGWQKIWWQGRGCQFIFSFPRPPVLPPPPSLILCLLPIVLQFVEGFLPVQPTAQRADDVLLWHRARMFHPR